MPSRLVAFGEHVEPVGGVSKQVSLTWDPHVQCLHSPNSTQYTPQI